MKKIALILMLVMILGSMLLAQDVYFKSKEDSKQIDFFGYTYTWNAEQHAWVVTDITVPIHWELYWGTYDHPSSIAAEGIVYPNDGYYFVTLDPWGVWDDAHYLKIECEGKVYTAEFNYGTSTQIDIYIGHGPYPTPDNTIPAER